MTQITHEKQKGPKNGCFDWKIKNFHKNKVDGLKKLSTRDCLFYDLLHFRGCPLTKSQFSQGAINRIPFFSTFLTLPHIPGSLGIKISNCLFYKHYFQRIAIVKAKSERPGFDSQSEQLFFSYVPYSILSLFLCKTTWLLSDFYSISIYHILL